MQTTHADRIARARAELIKARTLADLAGALSAGNRITLAICDLDVIAENLHMAREYYDPREGFDSTSWEPLDEGPTS